MRAYLRSIPLVLSLTLLVPQATTAQVTITPSKTIRPKTTQKLLIQGGLTRLTPANRYAAESLVINRSDWIDSINADGTGYSEHTVAATVQTDAVARQLGVIGIPFASASEHVVIEYARVRHKDGTVTQSPVSDAIEQPTEVTREAPFYSDLKQEELPVKNLQVGDTLEWQARIVRTKPQAPNQFWGSQSFLDDTEGVALEESVTLRLPAANTATVWTNPRLGIQPVKTVDGTTKTYFWKTSQLTPTAGPEADAAKKAKKGKFLTPDEEQDVEQGKLPSVAWTSFKSWAEVGAWYRGLEGTRAVPNDDIKAKVASLIAGKTTQEDKVRAVYGYVSSQIHYIGVAFGIGRYQPHEADDVLQNQYGDCKDKATLLASMLEVLGLHPDSVLIGADVRRNDAVPSPAAFNHLITRVQVDGKEVWLDPTTEIAPYQALVFQLRDKLALVVPEQGVATLERTPKSLPYPSIDKWNAVGSLNKDGVSESHITLTLRGDNELIFRSAAHQVSPAQYNDLAQRIVAGGGYGGTVTNATFTPPDDTVQPFVMSFDYHRERTVDWPTLRIVAQLLPVSLPTVDDANPPSATIMIGTPHTELSDAAMKLPEGWTAELPEAQHYDSPWATYDVTYRFEKGTLYTERKLVILQRKVPASDWKAYKKWFDDAGIGQDPYIQLHRAYSTSLPSPQRIDSPSDKPGTVAGDSSDSVDTLLQKAEDAMRNLDSDTAKKLLQTAEAKDPNALHLWAEYGQLALLLGAPNEAETDCRKELALYPSDTKAYAVLATAEAMGGNDAEAMQTLHSWIAADPKDGTPYGILAGVLYKQKKYTESAQAGTTALSLISPDSDVQYDALLLFTGRAQIKAGMTAKGEENLSTLLKTSQDPHMTNEAAYTLADAKLDLPLDDQAIRATLAKLDTETSAWTLDEAPKLLRDKTATLIATWDTMGWILFREGKSSEAKTYLQAAVRNKPTQTIQKHLIVVENTLNTSRSKASIKSEALARDNEQADRTLNLGPSGGMTGDAEYKLLLSQGHLEQAEPTGDKALPNAREMLNKADFSGYFPAGSTAKLVRFGYLNCFSKHCILVLEP